MDFVQFRVNSVSPILMSNPAAMRRGASQGAGVKKIPSIEEEAESLCYRNVRGELFVPSDWIRSAGLGATRGRRIGKMAAAGPYKAGLFLTEHACVLLDKEDRPMTNYEIDVRRVVVQRQGVMRARPMITDWHCFVTFEHDPEIINLQTVTELLGLAGKIQGIGGYRVAQGGPFGRFTIELQKATEVAPKVEAKVAVKA